MDYEPEPLDPITRAEQNLERARLNSAAERGPLEDAKLAASMEEPKRDGAPRY